MDAVIFNGRLGNQMFQYAFVEELRARGRDAGAYLGNYPNSDITLKKVFPAVSLDSERIDVKYKHVSFESIEEIRSQRGDSDDRLYFRNGCMFYFERPGFVFSDDVFCYRDCVYVGYWQSSMYFSRAQEVIRNKYTFCVEKEAQALAKEFEKDYVGIHVRRTDYLSIDSYKTYDVGYFEDAIIKMRELLGAPKFVVFSDDKEWAREYFGPRGFIICQSDMFKSYVDSYDLFLMTHCKALIISNSSFGWWGAWLNNVSEIIIAPKIWSKLIMNNSECVVQENKWILL